MSANWINAGKTILGHCVNTKKWYNEHKEEILLHPETRKWIEVNYNES